jgi:LysR family hydrogen peroxide-inducible transcriptional activator
VLSETRDLVDFARRLWSAAHRPAAYFGVIPTIAPYCCRAFYRPCNAVCPELRVELRESQTKVLLDELTRGALDLVMLALPIAEKRAGGDASI